MFKKVKKTLGVKKEIPHLPFFLLSRQFSFFFSDLYSLFFPFSCTIFLVSSPNRSPPSQALPVVVSLSPGHCFFSFVRRHQHHQQQPVYSRERQRRTEAHRMPWIPASSELDLGVFLKLDPWVLKTPR